MDKETEELLLEWEVGDLMPTGTGRTRTIHLMHQWLTNRTYGPSTKAPTERLLDAQDISGISFQALEERILQMGNRPLQVTPRRDLVKFLALRACLDIPPLEPQEYFQHKPKSPYGPQQKGHGGKIRRW